MVPAGTTVRVTFLFPDKGDNGWIYVNPRPGEGGGLVGGADIGIPGKIWIREDGEGVVEPVAERNAQASSTSSPLSKHAAFRQSIGQSFRYRRPGLLASNG